MIALRPLAALRLGLGAVGLGAGLVAAQRVAGLRDARAARLTETPFDHGMHAEDVKLRSTVNSRLHAWWVPASGVATTDRSPSEPSPAVLVVHGYASHAGDLLPLAPKLHDGGFHVLLLDMRGAGRSEPVDDRPRPPDLVHDVRVAVSWLAARADVTTVGVVGHSMGGSVAIGAAAEDARIAAVVAVAAVADPTLTRIGWWPAWVSRALLRTVARRQGIDPSSTFARERIREVAAPVLLLHGEQDRIVPPVHAHVLADARPDARLVLLPDAGHATFEAFLPALDDAVAFLADILHVG